eukprot:TRINITY_DN1797_c0_g2_i1.p1 TRINITY_DN1797_c0_g2~~TRINITY_DN1797_c0_g2_i1.p1  ORF type:complete len:233 (-),score=43.29 TRINITY_DN1797_c0_g2_i1:3-674(-)
MNRIELILLSSYFLISVFALTNYQTNPTNVRKTKTFAMKDPIFFEMVVVDGDNYSNPTLAVGRFFPKVDTYTALEGINFGNISTIKGNNDSHVYFQIKYADTQVLKSPLVRFATPTTFVDFYNVIITLNEGVPYAITFDELCDRCKDTCLGGGCPIQYSDRDCTKNRCNPKAYVAFYGTDSAGKSLMSSANLISRLQNFSINGLVDQGHDFYNAVYERIENSL